MLTVITGWSPSGWKEYGQNFVRTWQQYWPESAKLVVYTEGLQDLGPKIENRNVCDIPGCGEFILKHRNDALFNGRKPLPTWKQKQKDAGYNFRFDAWKFCRQGFIPYDAALKADTELLCWLDGDVITRRQVPEGFIEKLLPEGKDVAFLGRGEKHSEIGFQLYRLPNALPMLKEFSELYRSERIFNLKEWHSAYAFDAARRSTGIAGHDVTPGGTGSVWSVSPLYPVTDHLKGKRKGAARA